MTVKSAQSRTYNETWMTSGSFSMLTSSKVFIGGSKEPFKLPGRSGKHNFVGCLRNVRVKKNFTNFKRLLRNRILHLTK